jgi:hypothetical protein
MARSRNPAEKTCEDQIHIEDERDDVRLRGQISRYALRACSKLTQKEDCPKSIVRRES